MRAFREQVERGKAAKAAAEAIKQKESSTYLTKA